MQFHLTTAGLAAFPNPANTGTAAILIDRIGVSDVALPGAPEDHAGLLALPNELKRLATFAGSNVGDDTIHVTIRDESPDTYTLRTFGLYSDAGVLLAYVTSVDPISEKTPSSMTLIAADLAFVSVLAAEVVFGNTDFLNPPATTVTAGVVRLATAAETAVGTDTTKAVTPFGLKSVMSAFAALIHNHDAADVVSGVFSVLRIPDLAMAKITGLAAALGGKADAAHTHDAGAVVSGVLNVLRIPDLAMAKVTGLAAALAAKADAVHTHVMADINGLAAALGGKSDTGHTHDAGAVVSGVLNVLRLPDLGMAKITGLAAALALKLDIAAFTWNTLPDRPDVAIRDTDVIFNSVQVKQSSAPVMGRIFLGDQTGGTRQLLYTGEVYDLPGAPLYADGGRVWTSTTFDPATKATLGVDAVFRDMAATRGDGTGFVYLGGVIGAARYLAYTGGAYVLAGAPLDVNGGRVWTSLTLDPTAATPAQFRANTGSQPLHPASVWSAAEVVAVVQAATLTLDLSSGLNFSTTMTGNRTLGAPSAAKPGQSGVMTITQDATGVRTLTFDAAWKFQNGAKPTLSTAPGARDILAFTVIGPGDVAASLMKNVK